MLLRIKDFVCCAILCVKSHLSSILKCCLGILISIFVVLFSGSHLYTFDFDARTKTILMVAFAALLAICYVLNLKTEPFLGMIKKRKFVFPSSAFLYAVIFCIWVVVSFLANENKSGNMNSYLEIAFMTCAAYALLKSFNLKTLSKWFSNVLTVIAVVSLIVYGYAMLAQSVFAVDISSPHSGYLVQNFLGFSFLGYGSNRLMGPFWEPGVYSTILLLGLMNEILLRPKPFNWFKTILFVTSIFLTYSTAGWILIPVVFFAFVNEKLNGQQRKIGLFIYASVACLAILIIAFVFRDKLFTENASLVTRLSSLIYGARVWLQSPMFGLGPVTARQAYFAAAPDIIDALTSTYAYILMSVGLLGGLYVVLPLVGCFFFRSQRIGTRVALLIFLLGLNFKENQFQILISLVFSLLIIDQIPLFSLKQTFDNFGGETVYQKFFQNRNHGVVSNIGYSALIKILAVFVGLLNVPIFNLYFGNDSSYGVWLTIVSISTWISILDLGLSNGLRTKLPLSLKSSDRKDAKKEISVSFQFSFAIGLAIILAGSILAYVLDWNSIFQIDKNAAAPSVLQTSMLLIILSIGLQFSFKTISPVIDSMGYSSISQLLPFLSNLLLLLFAIVGSRIFSGDKFIPMASWYIVSMVLPYLVAFLIVFLGPLKDCKPSLKIENRGVKSLMKLNALFFVIQISNLFLNSINDLLVTQVFGPSYVTDLTKYTKIFSTISSSFSSIIQAPIWVAVAKAARDGDAVKIEKIRKYVWVAGAGVCVVLAVIAVAMPVVFDIWLGSQQPEFSWATTFVCAASSILTVLLLCTTIPSNGLGAIKSQALVYLIGAILKIPLVLVLKPLLGDYISFSVVLLANDLVLWIYLITGNIELRRALRKVRGFTRL